MKWNDRGFSLIEAMIVVAMAGVITAIGLPAISDVVRKERARGELLKVADAVEEARNAARVEACKTLVTVDATSQAITLGPDATDPDTPCRAMPTRTFQFNAQLVTLAPFNAGNPLAFNASGGINSTAHARMTVTLVGGATRSIDVWPATGAVRLQ